MREMILIECVRHTCHLMCHQELWIGQQWILFLPEEQNEKEEDGSRWSVVLQDTVTCYPTIHTFSTHQLLCLVVGTTSVEE